MWRFAWQNLLTKPTRTLLAVLGLSIPVLAILGLFSLTEGIRTLMGNTLEKMNGLMVLSENSPAPVFSDLRASLGNELRKVPGVRVVAPEVWKICPPIEGRNIIARATVQMLTKKDESRFSGFAEMIMIEGQQLPEHLQLKSGVFEKNLLPKERGGGRFLALSDVGQPNIIISTHIAETYPNTNGKPKAVGEPLLIGGKPFTIIGIYDTGSLLLDTTVVMEITTARKLLNVADSAVSAFYIEPERPTDIDDLDERIERTIPDVQVRSMAQLNVRADFVMGRLDMLLLLAISLALLVGGVGIANTMLMSATERYVEFGVMRTNGWTRRNVLGLVTAESTLLGLLAGLLGTVLAVAGIEVVNSFLTEIRLMVTPTLLLASNAVAIVIATISGLYPAWRASRMTPMDAIRSSTV
jgi:putative ABC transport system permease protein